MISKNFKYQNMPERVFCWLVDMNKNLPHLNRNKAGLSEGSLVKLTFIFQEELI